MMRDMARDTKTRSQGVYARHRQGCALEGGGRCDCRPMFYGRVWDRVSSRQLSTRRYATVGEARAARALLVEQVRSGERPSVGTIRLRDALDRFVMAAEDGRALNKNGRRYKTAAVANIRQSLSLHVVPRLGGKRLSDVRRGDVQSLVDELSVRLSGSRVRNVVNSLRALYAWAQDHDLTTADPARRVRLPAMNATPVSRIATPVEMSALLDVLPNRIALPFALAAYAGARNEQSRRLDWRDVDLGSFERVTLGALPDARKTDAAFRTLPLIRPLAALLRRVWMAAGRPSDGLVLPGRVSSRSGLLSFRQIQNLADDRWSAAKLERITFQQSRHSCATWLDAAGVSPRIASFWLGHTVPKAQPGAAQITLGRYTHTLPDDVMRAAETFERYMDRSTGRQVMDVLQ